jgi:beta-glucuronidase
MITKKIVTEAQNWHNKYKKPVLISEYGADSLTGLHEVIERYNNHNILLASVK